MNTKKRTDNKDSKLETSCECKDICLSDCAAKEDSEKECCYNGCC